MIKISSDCCLMFSLTSLNGVSLEYSDIAQRAEITQAFFFPKELCASTHNT